MVSRESLFGEGIHSHRELQASNMSQIGKTNDHGTNGQNISHNFRALRFENPVIILLPGTQPS